MKPMKVEEQHCHDLRGTMNEAFSYHPADSSSKCTSPPTQGRNAPGPMRRTPTSSNSSRSTAPKSGPPFQRTSPVRTP